MFFFEIRFEELPAQLEISKRWFAESRTIGSFGRARASSSRVTALAKSSRRDWPFCHSGIRRSATRRNRSGMRAKSTMSIV